MTRSDAELIAAAQTDPQSYREFYDRYAMSIRSWFERHVGSEAVALDLTAETFAQAWFGLPRFRDIAEGSGAPWVFGIARNLLRQYYKSSRIETAARQRLGVPLVSAECEDYEQVDERMVASTIRPALLSAVSSLPLEQREALELRVVEQMSYDEVADRLGCSLNAARLRVSRALRSLTTDLAGVQA